jgi:DNA-3-methyladenine glycosylase
VPAAVRRLRRAALPPDTVSLARYLIGKTLVHDSPQGRASGRIVETEAYVIGGAAGHAFRGQTQRNRSLFLRRGHAYVYFIYGVSYLLNVSSEQAGIGAGVLLRALEPLEGVGLMRKRRGIERLEDLARGPGRLTVAMGVGIHDDGLDLCGDGSLWLGTEARSTGEVGVSIRIGITREAHRPLRFYETGSRFVSGPGRLNRVLPLNPEPKNSTQRRKDAKENKSRR